MMFVKPKIITLTIIIDANPHRLYEMPDVWWMGVFAARKLTPPAFKPPVKRGFFTADHAIEFAIPVNLFCCCFPEPFRISSCLAECLFILAAHAPNLPSYV